jgi:hypothetical protein
MPALAATCSLAVALLGATPSLSDRRPDWIDGDSVEWPRQMYLLGVGVADDRPTAEQRARVEIARTFTSTVKGTSSISASETSRSGGGAPAASTSTQSVREDAQVSTEKVLTGVQIVAAWQDPTTRQVYALAALERSRAAARLQTEVSALDGQIQSQTAALRGSDATAAVLAGLRIRGLSRRRAQLVEDIRVIAPRADPAPSTASLDSEVDAVLRRVTVALVLSGDQAKSVSGGVITGLRTAGLVVQDGLDPARADLAVHLDVGVEDLGQRDGWYWTRATGAFTLQAVGDGRVLLRLDDSERVAAQMQPESAPRATRLLSSKLATRIPGELEAALAQ